MPRSLSIENTAARCDPFPDLESSGAVGTAPKMTPEAEYDMSREAHEFPRRRPCNGRD